MMLAPVIAAGPLCAGSESSRSGALAPDIVWLTGAGVSAPAPVRSPAHTLVVDISERAAAGVQPPAANAGPLVPPGTVWPDESDHIHAPDGRDPLAAPNPWEVRNPRGRAREEVVIACGGIIFAEGGESVVLLNGRPARAGSVVAGLTVACIARSAVVLEANGSFYAIPRGRRVTVER